RQYEVGTETGAARFAPRDEHTPVVVGVDGSEPSRLAVRHAVVAARTRSAPLHLLTVISAFEDWGGSSMSWMPDPELMERHRRARRAARGRRGRAAGRAPGPEDHQRGDPGRAGVGPARA